MGGIEKLMHEERDYPDRIETGQEAIQILADWYSKLNSMGYYIKNDILFRASDNKELALIHRIETQTISVLPLLSWY